MARIYFSFLLVLGVLGAALATPAAAQSPGDPFAALADSLAREHMIPAAERFAAAAEGLDEAMAGGCDNLDAARAGFQETMDAWMGLQHIRFGPITYLLRDSRLYFWPDKTNALSRQLGKALAESDPSLLTPATLIDGSVALQGLPALERLLYGAEAEEGEPTYRCGLIGAIAANIAQMARGLLHDWRDGDRPYLMLIETADSDDALFVDSREVVGRFLKGMDEALHSIDELRLGRPLGEDGGRARPRRAESWRSERSARNIRLILDALTEMAAPVSSVSGAGGGFAGLLRAEGKPDLAQRLTARFDQTNAAARALGGDDLTAALEDDARRALVEDLRAQVRETRDLVIGEVAPALEIPLGFNAMDGD